MGGVFRGKRAESLGARGWSLGQVGGVFRGKGVESIRASGWSL